MLSRISLLIGVFFSLFYFTLANAETVAVNMYRVSKTGHGSSLGSGNLDGYSIWFVNKTQFARLTAGKNSWAPHSMNPDCSNKGEAAGHLDPVNMSKHLGPYNPNGYFGDLPALTVEKMEQRPCLF